MDKPRKITDQTLVYDAVTIIIDTLTGKVTGEHPSNTRVMRPYPA